MPHNDFRHLFITYAAELSSLLGCRIALQCAWCRLGDLVCDRKTRATCVGACVVLLARPSSFVAVSGNIQYAQAWKVHCAESLLELFLGNDVVFIGWCAVLADRLTAAREA